MLYALAPLKVGVRSAAKGAKQAAATVAVPLGALSARDSGRERHAALSLVHTVALVEQTPQLDVLVVRVMHAHVIGLVAFEPQLDAIERPTRAHQLREAVLAAGLRVLGHVQHDDADEDEHKAAELVADVRCGLREPVLVHDHRRGDREDCEEDVVDGRDDRRVVRVECLVQVVHLRHGADQQREREGVCLPFCKLVRARCGELDRDAERLDGHHADRAHQRADGHVHDDVLVAVDGADVEDEHAHNQRDAQRVRSECRLECHAHQLLD
mmetsp:Transcript_17543/g.54535  ORF Transcript_17543/g.54535 Transcript_17543/m.54535 type:complete len:269 (+) Transcript_17543:131-937(+)